MLRRTTILAVAVLAMIAGPAIAAETDATTTNDNSTSGASKSQSKKNKVLTFTNADIDALPDSGNSTLPSLEDGTDPQAANLFVIIGTPAPEGADSTPPAPAPSNESLQWVEQMRAERVHSDKIAAAQRRVRRAEAQIPVVERGYRPKGSAFSDGGGNTNRLFVRGVASTSFKYDDAVREAYLELAAARAELESLLARSAESRDAATNGAS